MLFFLQPNIWALNLENTLTRRQHIYYYDWGPNQGANWFFSSEESFIDFLFLVFSNNVVKYWFLVLIHLSNCMHQSSTLDQHLKNVVFLFLPTTTKTQFLIPMWVKETVGFVATYISHPTVLRLGISHYHLVIINQSINQWHVLKILGHCLLLLPF